MQRFIFRRFISLAFTILGLTIVLFTIMFIVPADPARAAAGLDAGAEQVEALRVKFGLDKPAHIQYLTYMKNLVRGDLGMSILTRKPVAAELRIFLPATIELVATALLLVVILSVPLGVLAALRSGSAVDNSSRLVTALGVGMPVFWVALMAQLLFFGRLDILPFGGRLSLGVVPPPTVTGLYTIDSLIAGDFELFTDAVWHLIMPAVVLALPLLAVMSRLIRSSMLDVLDEDYLRTAHSKGLSEFRVITVHALRNSLLIPLTMFGMQIGWILGGTVLVETVFAWAGIGFLALHGVRQHDFPLVMGVTLVIAVAFVLANLVVDLLYAVLDPQIKDTHANAG